MLDPGEGLAEGEDGREMGMVVGEAEHLQGDVRLLHKVKVSGSS